MLRFAYTLSSNSKEIVLIFSYKARLSHIDIKTLKEILAMYNHSYTIVPLVGQAGDALMTINKQDKPEIDSFLNRILT